MKKVLILGGYGNFGWRITQTLVSNGIACVIAGRNKIKAQKLKDKLNASYPNTEVEVAIFDIKNNLREQLHLIRPSVVINTCGPFQSTDYFVAEECINAKVHYIDLADARNFVCNITSLNDKAQKANVLVVSGASSVPGLSSAVLEHFQGEFSSIESLRYGISPGQKADRGLATTQGILSYVGKPLQACKGNKKKRYGWQDIYRQTYPELGKRWMANCDVPDLDLFPKQYNVKSIQFSAGMESTLLHMGIWMLSWMVRVGLPLNLEKHAGFLFKVSKLFDHLGTANGGMHMIISGLSIAKKPVVIKWFIIAKDGDGPQIPIIPAIILTKRLLANKNKIKGAQPCTAMVGLKEYLEELSTYNIKTYTEKL